ncbi:MAG: hypothetical protein PVG25_13830, partial [Anaerolineae bacterium]
MRGVTCLRPVQSYHRKARKDRGQNHSLPPLPLGKESILQTVIPVKPRASYIRNLTITRITTEKGKGVTMQAQPGLNLLVKDEFHVL